MRPSDWFLVQVPGDPTPGDAFGVRGLAAKYLAIATIAGEASDGVTRARGSGAASAWIGDAGEVFRETSQRMPGELAKAHDSYSLVAEALRRWADSVDDTQAQADRGLEQARAAQADRASALAVLASAESSWSTVRAQQLTYQRVQKEYASVPPAAGVTLPTPDQLRSSARSARSAAQSQASIAAAQSRIADADARLAAARALVLDAKSRRDDAERTVVHRIAEAQERAVRPSSVWEAIQDSAAWQTMVVVATVVLTIVSILAIVVGGPLVWAIILAATLLLIANALLSIARGENAWGELALLAVGLIPGGRLVGLAVRGLSGAGRGGAAATHLAELTARITSSGTEQLAYLVRRLADDTGEWNWLALTRDLPWNEVKFSQRSVTFHKIDRITHQRYTYDDIVQSMRTNGWVGRRIDVVDLGDNGVTSVDNTRLLAAREANIPVKATIHDPLELLTLDDIKRFRTVGGPPPHTWGEAVYGRIADQWDGWGIDHPHGTFDLPTITGRPR